MADVDDGKKDVKASTESTAAPAASATAGELPHTQLNPYGGFQHKEFDVGYGEAPSVSVNPPVTSSSSKFIHPFMMERFIDDDGDTRLRIYGGYLYHCVNTIVFKRTEDDDEATFGSGNAYFMHVDNQPNIVGFTQEDVTGFTAIKDDDDNDTVYKSKEYATSEAYGDFYLNWQVQVSTGVPAGWPTEANDDVTFVDFTAVSLYRTAVGAGLGAVANIAALTTQGSGVASSDIQLRRGTGGGSDHVGNYYEKIGTSYDPAHEDTKSKTIEQVLFDHVRWSPTIVAESE